MPAPGRGALPLAVETAVELAVNGTVITTLMCTPCDLDVLAIGHLFTKGLVSSFDDVAGIGREGTGIDVRLKRPPARSGYRDLPPGGNTAAAGQDALRWRDTQPPAPADPAHPPTLAADAHHHPWRFPLRAARSDGLV